MLKIAFTHQYLKDLKRIGRRGLPKQELDEVVRLLAHEHPLPPKYKDHPLKGDFIDYRECHIRPDWLLVYKIDRQILTLILVRTGTHTDLF
jgi:mRNA interferase YafQ